MTDNIEILNFIHNLTDVSSEAVWAIETALELANAKGEDHIDMPNDVAVGVGSILKTQADLIKRLYELHATVQDQVNDLVQKLEES